MALTSINAKAQTAIEAALTYDPMLHEVRRKPTWPDYMTAEYLSSLIELTPLEKHAYLYGTFGEEPCSQN